MQYINLPWPKVPVAVKDAHEKNGSEIDEMKLTDGLIDGEC